MQTLRASLRQLGRFGSMLGRSGAMQHVYDTIEHIAPTEAAVLISGEAGTGEQVAARTMRDMSRRRKGPFVTLDCRSAASSQLHSLDSVLFGHERGAFSGADQREPGLFEQASGGTLFIDEIAELPRARRKHCSARWIRRPSCGRRHESGRDRRSVSWSGWSSPQHLKRPVLGLIVGTVLFAMKSVGVILWRVVRNRIRGSKPL